MIGGEPGRGEECRTASEPVSLRSDLGEFAVGIPDLLGPLRGPISPVGTPHWEHVVPAEISEFSIEDAFVLTREVMAEE
jgi:hypothetical protein